MDPDQTAHTEAVSPGSTLLDQEASKTFQQMTSKGPEEPTRLIWDDFLCPSQRFFSHVGANLPGLNQY